MYLLKFLREFIAILGKILGAKILANPISFLGVTSVFCLAIYMCWLDGTILFRLEEIIGIGIFYIIFLGVFMDKKALNSKDVKNDKLGAKEEIKQNNISLINFVKNIKK